MITHREYMRAGSELHHKYYLEIAHEIKLNKRCVPFSVDVCTHAVLCGDHALNTLQLGAWDRAAHVLNPQARAALHARGDYYSLGNGVCILKTYACSLTGLPERTYDVYPIKTERDEVALRSALLLGMSLENGNHLGSPSILLPADVGQSATGRAINYPRTAVNNEYHAAWLYLARRGYGVSCDEPFKMVKIHNVGIVER